MSDAAAWAAVDQILEEQKKQLAVIGTLYGNAIRAGVPEGLAEEIARKVAADVGLLSDGCER